ncbi:MAG: PAS domain S-box protein [Deltaproteobacteria bacterium]|nr:PAS domain S-box protein [Deltaproteobacteria bacterium]MBW2071644.1 PAS domain S-box protein [Deltaproteobacteria bacterium]
MNWENYSREQLVEKLESMQRTIAELQEAAGKPKEKDEAQRLTEARLRTLVETLPFDFFMIDDNGRYVMQNSACAEHWGDVIGKTPAELDFDRRYIALWEDNNRRAFAGETVMGEVSYEVAGQEMHFYNIISPVRLDNRIRGIVGINIDITELKQREKELRAAEKNYRTLAEFASDAIVVVQGGETVYRNTTYEQLLGYSVAETSGRSFLEVVAPEDRERIRQYYSRRLKGEAVPEQYEATIVTRSGRRITMEVKSCLIEYHGRPAAMAIMRDITERKNAEQALEKEHEQLEAEVEQRTHELQRLNRQLLRQIEKQKKADQALRQSERKFRGIFEIISDAYYRTDMAGNLLMVSPSGVRMLGYDTVEEVIGKNVVDHLYYNPEDRRKFIVSLLKQGSLQNYEVTLKKKDGTPLIGETNSLLVLNEKREPVAIEGIFRDITERKEAEEALRLSEERFRSIFEKSEDAICLIDNEGYCVMVNDAMCRLTGMHRKDLVGTHYSVFLDENTYQQMRSYWLQRKQGKPAPRRYEFELIRPDGEIRTVENVPTLIQLPSGTALTVAILRDVSERRRTTALLENLRARLLNLQEKERSNIAKTLHDSVGQNISVLDFNLTALEELITEYDRERFQGLINYMRRIISETGDMLRNIATGLIPREVQELGLVTAVRGFLDRFRQQTRLQIVEMIEVEELVLEENVAINIYRIIQEAFTNILKHAHCHSVHFQMELQEDHIKIRIRDDGRGFDLEGVSPEAQDGHGLGLFIMRERARAINGRLEIRARPEAGTELLLAVPHSSC